MAKNKGRPNKYFTNVEPRLEEIEKLCLTMTEKQMAEYMGVGYTSWKQYKLDYPPLSAVLKRGRTSLVSDLRSVLIKKAKGFQYEERKVIKEKGEVVKEEITVKTALPDVAAINLALKNYDKDAWANDPQTLELRKKELELRERQITNNEW